MKNTLYLLLLLACPQFLAAQKDSTLAKLSFTGDFRFRVEQDWNSRKADGSYRDDRTRLRYRARFGVAYDYKDWVSFGVRLRTGDPKKQQDPQLTLGDNFKEFGTLPIAFEKVYAQFGHRWFSGWIGKNTFPFEKQNAVFWSDNVFPEGIALSGSFTFENTYINSLEIHTGHFILATYGTSLSDDSYFEGIQLVTSHWEHRLQLFPAFYYFNKVPNIPDGNEAYLINYAIVHLGAKAELLQSPKITVGLDYYQNVENLNANDFISQNFKDQKQGFVANVGLGSLKKAGDWNVGLTYTYLERYAAVDFLAQNDWVRWDYSSQGSPDGRLTNFKGLEMAVGYALGEKMNLKIRCFTVDQLVPIGIAPENGNRIRLDFNIGF